MLNGALSHIRRARWIANPTDLEIKVTQSTCIEVDNGSVQIAKVDLIHKSMNLKKRHIANIYVTFKKLKHLH
jgi:hypothetical protein